MLRGSAVQLIERVEASFQVGEQRESRAALFSRILRRYRTQEFRDRRVARVAVLRAQLFEDLRFEVPQPEIPEAHAAGATRAEHHVPPSKLGPFAYAPRAFERGGDFLPGHA